MAKDFLKLKTDQKKLGKYLFCIGLLLTAVMGIRACGNTRLSNDYELHRNEAGEGSYEQELIVSAEGEEKIPVTLTVEERQLTVEEAEEMFAETKLLLDELLKGENENLQSVTKDLCFVDIVPDTFVEVEWISKAPEYFHSDGTWREDVTISEPLEVKLTAILSCQEFAQDYEAVVTLQPRNESMENTLLRMAASQSEKAAEKGVIQLPREYNGKKLTWRKPMDLTFLYLFVLTMSSVLFLKAGEKRDERLMQKERLEQMERDYPQIVSKFTMLLSAGLSVRNAWERIVGLYRRKNGPKKLIYEEMNRALREMEKGVSEIVVYEAFGATVGQVHYKKLMTLFISDKKRGSVQLLEMMNQEMLQAFEEQKRKTRQQGEKIGTKLLIPMMGMLAVVFLMILVPAFLSFQL